MLSLERDSCLPRPPHTPQHKHTCPWNWWCSGEKQGIPALLLSTPMSADSDMASSVSRPFCPINQSSLSSSSLCCFSPLFLSLLPSLWLHRTPRSPKFLTCPLWFGSHSRKACYRVAQSEHVPKTTRAVIGDLKMG